MEHKGAQGNLDSFKGSARRSNGRKKTQEKGQRGEISQMTQEEEEKRKHKSALRALKNILSKQLFSSFKHKCCFHEIFCRTSVK